MNLVFCEIKEEKGGYCCSFSKGSTSLTGGEMRQFNGQRGANALEYALVAVVVIMVIWVGFDAFGVQLNQFLAEVGNDIIGVGRDLQMGPAR